MSHPTRQLLLIAGACALGFTAQAFAVTPAENTLEIVVGNGPHAGRYERITNILKNKRGETPYFLQEDLPCIAEATDIHASGAAYLLAME